MECVRLGGADALALIHSLYLQAGKDQKGFRNLCCKAGICPLVLQRRLGLDRPAAV